MGIIEEFSQRRAQAQLSRGRTLWTKTAQQGSVDWSNYEQVRNWLESISDFLGELEGMDDQVVQQIVHETVERLVDHYLSISGQEVVQIYRAITIPKGVAPLQAIDWQNIGSHWSSMPEGVGSYGNVPEGVEDGEEVVVQGEVSPENVDWEYSMTSFVYYPEQSEVSLNAGAPVKVTSVGGQPVSIDAVAYDTQEWRRREQQGLTMGIQARAFMVAMQVRD